MTNYSRSVLKSNGLRHSKNPPVKFSFSLKIVPATIAKKLPLQLRPKPLFIAFFSLSHKWPTFAFTPKAGTHSASLKESHTRAHTPKQGSSLPRPQQGFALPVKSLQSLTFATLDSATLLYTYISRFSVNPHYQQKRNIRQSYRHKFYPQPLFIVFFNFLHKRPTFAFTSESGHHTLGSRRKIAHSGSHAETGVFPPPATARS